MFKINGAEISRIQIKENGIDDASLADGIYFITIETNKALIMKNIIKE